MDSSKKNTSSFLTNPFEVLAFLVVGVIFISSVYSLIENKDFNLVKIEEIQTQSKTRSPASASEGKTGLIKLECDSPKVLSTDLGRVRLSGPICPLENRAPAETLENKKRLLQMMITVTNQKNQTNATVFAEPTLDRFSTDYFVLEPGKNAIQVVITEGDLPSKTYDYTIDRN